jgi:prepilin-type N-terminal cleavage/methylation domain-containing protein
MVLLSQIRCHAHKGFSLAEMLTALAVFGVITALIVPNVIYNISTVNFRTNFRTTIKLLTDITSQMTNQALTLPNTAPVTATNGNTTWHAFAPFINGSSSNFVMVGDANNSFTLKSGTLLSRFVGNYSDGGEAILVDVNGTEQPNAIGTDRLMLSVCFNPLGTCTAIPNITVKSADQESGTVGPTPDATAGTGNVAFYNSLIGG